MNFYNDYKEFIEWKRTKDGTAGPTVFTAEEDVSIRLFVAYLNCRYAKAHLTSSSSRAAGACVCQPMGNDIISVNPLCPAHGMKPPPAYLALATKG
jgi:hypothetical protein